MVVEPRTLAEVISLTPAMCPSCRSSGAAMDDAMISGLAPGNDAWTEMVGKSTCGNGATASCRYATIPANATATVNSAVPTGRRMNGAEMFTAEEAEEAEI